MFTLCKNILICGMGRTGQSVFNYLKDKTDSVFCYDDADYTDHITDTNFFIELIVSKKIDYIILSPGIQCVYDDSHPIVIAARMLGVNIMSDLDLFQILNPGKHFIGITGTNGKTTTAYTIYNMLVDHNINVDIGGNIGIPAIEMRWDADIYVIEASSYQLQISNVLMFDVGIITNINSTYHELKHNSVYSYIGSKQRIFMKPKSWKIVNIDCPISLKMSQLLHNIVGFSIRSTKSVNTNIASNDNIDLMAKPDITWHNNTISAFNNRMHLNEVTDKNIVSICMAVTHIMESKMGYDRISFDSKYIPQLPHRQEVVWQSDNKTIINDSKSTNTSTTIYALKNLAKVCLIIHSNFNMIKALNHYPNIIMVIIINSDNKDIAIHLSIPYHVVPNIEQAVYLSIRLTQKLDEYTILFSPGYPSIDHFKNYEERGNCFKKYVVKYFEK